MGMSTFIKRSLYAAVLAGLGALGTAGTFPAVGIVFLRRRKETVPFRTQVNIKTKVKKNRTIGVVKNFACQKRERRGAR
jgi:hypothetical protein